MGDVVVVEVVIPLEVERAVANWGELLLYVLWVFCSALIPSQIAYVRAVSAVPLIKTGYII